MNQINARIQYKYDSEANWNKSTFISLAGETYVHQYDDGKVKLKFGDGIHKVPDLPFVNVGLDEGDMTGVSEVQIIQQPDGIKLRWKSPYQHSKYRQTELRRTNAPYLLTFEEESPKNSQLIETTHEDSTKDAYLMSNEGELEKTIFKDNDEDRAISDKPGYCEYVDEAELVPGQEYTYVFIVYDKKNKIYESEEYTITFTDGLTIYKDNFRFYIDGELTNRPTGIPYILKTYDGNKHTLVIKYYDPSTETELDGTDVAYIRGILEYTDVEDASGIWITPKNAQWEDGTTEQWPVFAWGLSPAKVTLSIDYPEIRNYIRLLETDNGTYKTDTIKINITNLPAHFIDDFWSHLKVEYEMQDAQDMGPKSIVRNSDYTVDILFTSLFVGDGISSSTPNQFRGKFNLTISSRNYTFSNESIESFIVRMPTLKGSTWEEIATIKNPSAYFNVGDTKKIILDGDIGDYLTLHNQELNVYIVDFAYNGIYFAGFKDMSNNNICLIDSKYGTDVYNTKSFALNSEDWDTSTLREVLGSESKEVSESDNTLMKALPEEFRSKLKEMDVLYPYPSYDYSQGFIPTMTTDYITVPDLDELIYSNQFEYFIYNNDLKMNSLTDNSPKCWVTRGCSVHGEFYESQWEAASYIDENGEVVSTPDSNNLNTSYGVVPIFLVGH